MKSSWAIQDRESADSFGAQIGERSVTVFVDLDLGTGVDAKRDAGDPSLE